MPPLSGPWDTQEEKRRLDAYRPWTTVRRRGDEQLRPLARTRNGLPNKREGEIRRDRKESLQDETASVATSSPAPSSANAGGQGLCRTRESAVALGQPPMAAWQWREVPVMPPQAGPWDTQEEGRRLDARECPGRR